MDLLSSLKQHTGDDAEARELHPEIDVVIEEFVQLEAQAQAKQQRLKENRYYLLPALVYTLTSFLIFQKSPNKGIYLISLPSPLMFFYILQTSFCQPHIP